MPKLKFDRASAPLIAVLLALAVFATGRMGIDLSRQSGSVAAIWIANAIPLAIMLVRPPREWWSYAAAAGAGYLALNLLSGTGLVVSLGFTVCNLGEVLIAAVLLRRWRAADILGSLRSALLFFGLGIGLSVGIAAALGAFVVSQAFGVPFLQVWHAWWIADAMGMLILTPALVVLFHRDRPFRPSPLAVAEFTLLAAGLATATALGSDSLLGYSLVSHIGLKALLPLVIWAAVRFGRGGATLANLLMATMGIGSVLFDNHVGSGGVTLLDNLEAMQLHLMSTAGTALLLAALLAERRSAMARLNDAIESMNESFALFDADDRLVLANSRHRQTYAGSKPLFTPGARFEDIIRGGIALGQHPDANGREEEWVHERMRRHNDPGEPFEQHLGDGRWEMISERPTSEGGTVGVWTDITALKQQEIMLREREEQLKATIDKLEFSESELQQRAMTLRELARERSAQRQQADAANRAKSDFLAMMSHEIRSPLNGIMGYTDQLLDSSLAPEQRRSAEIVRQCGKALITVIDEILDFSKIEAGKLELACDHLDLADVLDDVAAMTRVAAQGKGLRLTVAIGDDVPRHVKGDEGRLRQILLNLVSNAIKFTESGSIDIGVELVDAGAERAVVRFAVRDSGIGIPLEAQAYLFDAFYQVDGNYRRKAGGTGLGLAICRKLVHLMGGEISVQSMPGMGSRFEFTADLARGAGATAMPEATVHATEDNAPARILLVDDLELNRDIAVALLTQAGHTVDIAADGAEAVAAVAAGNYDLVLMDVQMPVMDGFEATAKIRALPAPQRDVPIIAMTAYATRQDIEHCKSAGMNGHIAKPIERRTLLDAVRSRATESGTTGEASVDATSRAPLSEGVLEDLELDVGRDELARLANAILKRLEAGIEQMRGDAEAGRYGQIESAAHKLIAATGSVGLLRVSARCAELQESAARATAEDPGDLSAALERLQAATAEAVPLLLVRLPECRQRPIEQLAWAAASAAPFDLPANGGT